mmetsp:Transcript_28524/g.42695  ORF Transcript_28524/g.42695 Transcript_28524/m.42695 type:complete len:203 (+) Transcript_28524:64-672(+)
MTSVVELFPKSQKLSYDSRQQLSQVQNGVMHASELFLSLDELNNQLSIMESLIHKETPAKREMWRRKILELREDASSIRRQGEYYNRMVTAGARQKQEREELMRRRRVRKGGGDDYENAMNDLADESQSIEQSHQMVGEIIASGQASLARLVEQRQRLQGIKRALLDIGNTSHKSCIYVIYTIFWICCGTHTLFFRVGHDGS